MQLQREYRHMELNRRAYAEETQSLLRKQQGTIDKLRKDNDSLKNEMAMIMRSTNRPLTSLQQEAIQRLQEQGEKYVAAIEGEKKNISTMEEQISIMKQRILHQRRSMGGVNASKENQYMIEKQIRILENRLEKALVKFNEALNENKHLRNKIDDLRRERVVFENIYRKMERELQEKKKKMAEIIELSNQSYEQRDSYQMEVAAIEQSNRKEQEEFEEQMLELGRLLETDLALPAAGGRTGGFAGFKTLQESFKNRGADMNKSTKSLMAGTDFDHTTMERVQNFEEAFNKIKSATGITNIDELVSTFIKNEDHNFSLFNYVNEQNNEIEKIEESIAQLREEERKYAQENGDDANQHKAVLRELESKLQATEAMAEKYEVRCQDLTRTNESLKRGVYAIFQKMDIGGSDGGGLSDTTVTESNMVHYLGLIEQTTNSLLEKYADVKALLAKISNAPMAASASGAGMESPTRSITSILGTGPKVAMGVDMVHVNPPRLDDYNSDEDEEEDDEDTRPFTREELKARTLNKLQRRGQGVKSSPKKKAGKGR